MQRDIDEELAFHIEERVAALIARGVSPSDARARAEREFGDVRAARTELASIDRRTLRRERRAEWWDALWQDTRSSLRAIRRNPGFSAAVVLTLALGVGVNAAIFGITDRLLLSAPPHVTDADEIVRVLYEHTPPSGVHTTSAALSYPDYTNLRDNVPSFVGVAAYGGGGIPSVLGRGEAGVPVRVAQATWTLFPTLGVQPALGRFFTSDEDAVPVGRNVIVLSHGLWQERFGGDAAVIGSTIDIDHTAFEVVGVAPRGFNGIDLDPVHAWVPVSAVAPQMGGENWYDFRGMEWLRVVARLAPGAAVDVARQQASAALHAGGEWRRASDPSAGAVLGSAIVGRAPAIGSGLPQRSGRIALWLLGVSLLVVVIACANVANLLLARGMRRRRETGVRLALGVSRLRLASQTLIETLVIALLGMAVGLLIAHWGGQAIRAMLLPDMEWTGSPISGRVLILSGVVTLAAVLLAGLAPAVSAALGDPGSLLGPGGRSTYRRSRLRSGLVVLQATLSLLLLVGAGLFVRSLREVSAVPLGFDPDAVVTFNWHRTGLDWDAARVKALYDAGLERVSALPQVEAAALAFTEPMWSMLHGALRVPGLDSVPTGRDIIFTAVSPDYFTTMGARVVRGRSFAEADAAGDRHAVVVSESLAALLWPGDDAIGRCLVHTNEPDAVCREVVGIVDDVRYATVLGDPTLMYFIPLSDRSPITMRSLLVRTRGDTDAAIAAVRASLQTLEPGLPFVQATALRDRVAPQLQPWRLGAVLFTAFGVLALLLASIGLYGVVAYDVAQRRRELGVRAALGARAGTLLRMVLGDALGVVALGVVIGLAAAGWAARWVEPLLFDVSPRDPRVLGGVAALLLAIGAIAALVPARRAAGVHPVDALKE